MDGETLDSVFEGYRKDKKKKKKLTLDVPQSLTTEPSEKPPTYKLTDSITEQAHAVTANWDKKKTLLDIKAKSGGEGLYIPWIKASPRYNEQLTPEGNPISPKALGTYTPVVPAGSNVSWVATGPFSGCKSLMLSNANGGRVFAHIVTAGTGETADAHMDQARAIATKTSTIEPTENNLHTPAGKGLAYVFWMKISGTWHRRTIYVAGDRRTVNGVDVKQVC